MWANFNPQITPPSTPPTAIAPVLSSPLALRSGSIWENCPPGLSNGNGAQCSSAVSSLVQGRGPPLYSPGALQGFAAWLRQQSGFQQRGQQNSSERNCYERARPLLAIIRIRVWIAASEWSGPRCCGAFLTMSADALGEDRCLGKGGEDICLPCFITLSLARGYSLVYFKTCVWKGAWLY